LLFLFTQRRRGAVPLVVCLFPSSTARRAVPSLCFSFQREEGPLLLCSSSQQMARRPVTTTFRHRNPCGGRLCLSPPLCLSSLPPLLQSGGGFLLLSFCI